MIRSDDIANPITQRIYELARKGADIEMVTMILRSENVPDYEIRVGYDEVALYTTTEVVRGQFYLRALD